MDASIALKIALRFIVTLVVLDPGSEWVVQVAVESTMEAGTWRCDKGQHIQLDVTPFVFSADLGNFWDFDPLWNSSVSSGLQARGHTSLHPLILWHFVFPSSCSQASTPLQLLR